MRGYVVYSGKSAYEIAVDNGFTGSEKEWLDSLKGAPGENGENGQDGAQGLPGLNGLPWIHTPLEYGAKADGITDDSAAFNAAIMEHDYVYVPAGVYKINGHNGINLRDNVTVEMSNDATLLLVGEDAYKEATVGYVCFRLVGCQNVTIKGGKIIGDRTSDYAFSEKGSAISMSMDMNNDNKPYRNITIDGVYIEGIKGDGIQGYGQIETSETNKKGVFDSHMPGNILIKNTTVTKCYRHGTFISSGDGITFQNCRYIDNGGRKDDYLQYIESLESEEERFNFIGGNSTERGLLYQLRQYKSTHPLKILVVRLNKSGSEEVENETDLEKVRAAEKLWLITSWTKSRVINASGEPEMRYVPASVDSSVGYKTNDSRTHVILKRGLSHEMLLNMLNAWDSLTYGSSLDMERHLQYESMHNLVLDNFQSSGSPLGVQISPAYSDEEYELYKDYGYDRYSLITSLTLNNCTIMDRVTASAAVNSINGGTYSYLVTSSAKALDIKKAIIHKLNIAGSGKPYTKEINIEDSSIYPIDNRVIISCEGGSEKFGEYTRLNIHRCTLSTLKTDTRPEDMQPHGGLANLSLFATQGKLHSVGISDSVININCPTGVYIHTQKEGDLSLNRCTINVNYRTSGKLRNIFALNGALTWSINNCVINTDNAQYTEKDTSWGFIEMSHEATASLVGNIYNGDAFSNAIRAHANTAKTIVAANNVFPKLNKICFETGTIPVVLRDVGNILLS